MIIALRPGGPNYPAARADWPSVEFDVFKFFPAWSRRAARAVLPASLVDRMRGWLLHVFYGRTLSTVRRENKLVTYVRRRILRSRPVLFHLDVHVTDHCNMRCRGCSHFSNISTPRFTDLAEFEADFERLGAVFYGIKEMYLLGGEPLLHPHVASFVRVAHSVFPKTRIYLFTNSLLVTRMDESVWSALAETGCILYCDRYPVDLPVAEIDAMAAERGVTVKWTEDRSEFFTIPIDLTGSQNARESFAACNGIDNCVNLSHGRLYPCARIAYIDIFREHFDIEGLGAGDTDSISIYEERDPWEVMDFLLAPVPWCRHCDQDGLRWYPWSRGDRSIEQWLCEPAHSDEPESAPEVDIASESEPVIP